MLDAARPRLSQVWTSTQLVAPGWSLSDLNVKLSFALSMLQMRRDMADFLSRPEQEALNREVERNLDTLGFAIWPYIHAGWSARKRFEVLSLHHQLLSQDLRALTVQRGESLDVADLSQFSSGLRLTIDRPPWFKREGSLVLNQFRDGQRLTSIAFTLGVRNGQRVAYVGCLQGANPNTALPLLRDTRKDLHGLRTRDFLIKAFQLLMQHIGVQALYCVSDATRHHRHRYFKEQSKEELHLNYDAVWQEHGAVATMDGFYQLGVVPHAKAIHDIESKKRAQYRRRYAMLDELSALLALRFPRDGTFHQPN